MQQSYWTQFWQEYTSQIDGKDFQSQVLRTRNGQPVSESDWQKILESVTERIPMRADHSMLDLCCGNGLFSVAYADSVKDVTAVDLSLTLIEVLKRRGKKNIRTVACDLRELKLTPQQFDSVIWYAGIQYFTEPEIVGLMKSIFSWMKPGGSLMIGDIPDRLRMWNYFNNSERKTAFFNRLEEHKPIIGTWIDRDWLKHLGECIGFSSVEILKQSTDMVYSDFRFDALIMK